MSKLKKHRDIWWKFSMKILDHDEILSIFIFHLKIQVHPIVIENSSEKKKIHQVFHYYPQIGHNLRWFIKIFINFHLPPQYLSLLKLFHPSLILSRWKTVNKISREFLFSLTRWVKISFQKSTIYAKKFQESTNFRHEIFPSTKPIYHPIVW